ncbi:unnamed protein product [Protopolystoma xenopodis]|uniref:Uncharacterized protein n=1 Tax=Protopolystoma xenopodis TaxID=117903 RepID=A0A3S5A9A0_9PLAT|nr:unnamed protein product [Protopolystoma xenopodis]
MPVGGCVPARVAAHRVAIYKSASSSGLRKTNHPASQVLTIIDTNACTRVDTRTHIKHATVDTTASCLNYICN